MGPPKPFDVVAVLQPIMPEALQLTEECYDLSAGLAAGTVGTVVDVFPRPAEPVMCLVELSDTRGAGYAFATVPAEALLVLHYDPLAPVVTQQYKPCQRKNGQVCSSFFLPPPWCVYDTPPASRIPWRAVSCDQPQQRARGH
jgi:hypothetical protein